MFLGSNFCSLGPRIALEGYRIEYLLLVSLSEKTVQGFTKNVNLSQTFCDCFYVKSRCKEESVLHFCTYNDGFGVVVGFRITTTIFIP